MNKGSGKRTGITKEVLQALKDIGPMSNKELAQFLKRPKTKVISATGRLNRDKNNKRLYITHWVFDAEGERVYPRPVFALGALRDAQQPKTDNRVTRRRWRERHNAKYKMNSVFNMGQPLKELKRRAAATAASHDHEHEFCEECSYCIPCGECDEYGCGPEKEKTHETSGTPRELQP